MRVLCTGGAGFIGSHLVDALVAEGHEVFVIDWLVEQVHLTGKWPDWINPGAQYERFPLANHASLRRVLGGKPLARPSKPSTCARDFRPDIIYHLAAQVGVGQGQYDLRRYVFDNCGDTATLLEEVLQMGVRPKKIVVASSMSIYGEGRYQCLHGEETCTERCHAPTPMPTREDDDVTPTSVYAITKYFQEMLVLNVCESYGIPAVALRYFNVFGKRQALSNPYTGVCAIFLSRLKNGQPPLIYEDGLQSRDFISVHDITQANMLAGFGNATGVFNVCTGVPTTVLEVAETLAGVVQPESPILPEVTGKKRAGDIRHCFGCPERAKAVLGFEAEVSFEEGMRDLWAWARDQEATDGVAGAHQELVARGLVDD